jgi:chromosome segregation ATPase
MHLNSFSSISASSQLKSRNSDLCNLLESSTAAHQSTQDQLNLAQQSLLQSQTFNKDLQERIASLKHDVSAVELQRQRLESDFALEKALKQRAESELQTVKGELHALQQTINTERDRVKVLGDDKSAWLARIQKAESELALVNADRATKLDRAAAEANTLVEQTRAKFEQVSSST